MIVFYLIYFISDVNENTSALVNGSFTHSNFKIGMQILLLTLSVCCYLTQDKNQNLCFWEGFFDGKVRLEGLQKT